MGFWDKIVAPVLVGAAGVFGGAAGATAVAGLLGDGAEEEEIVTKVGLGEGLKSAVKRGATGLVLAETAMVTGAMRKRTIVQTLDAAGNIVKSKTTKGGVAVFQQDVTAANRVARQLRRLDKRMPRKIIKQSETARLTQEVTNAALRRARDNGDCPPPPCPR